MSRKRASCSDSAFMVFHEYGEKHIHKNSVEVGSSIRTFINLVSEAGTCENLQHFKELVCLNAFV